MVVASAVTSGRAACEIVGELDAGFLRQRTHGGHRAFRERVEVELGTRQAAPEVRRRVAAEQAIDQRQRVPGVVVDVGGVAAIALVGDRAEALILHDLGGGGDGAQGRAQLVRQLGNRNAAFVWRLLAVFGVAPSGEAAPRPPAKPLRMARAILVIVAASSTEAGALGGGSDTAGSATTAAAVGRLACADAIETSMSAAVRRRIRRHGRDIAQKAFGAVGRPEDQRLAPIAALRLAQHGAQAHERRHGRVQRSGGGVGSKAKPRGAGGVGGEDAAFGGVDEPSGIDAACERLLRAGCGRWRRCARAVYGHG